METVLLLSPPTVVVVKDAARAVKRVDSLTVQAVTVETLNELLGLPRMRATQFAIEQQGEERYLHLFCEHQYDVAICPRCGQAMVGGYDHKDRCVRHLDIWGMRTLVHFPQRRFDCEVCGKPFTETLEWIDPKRRQTRAYEEHIYQRVQKTSRKHVALQEGLSESTVLDIFKKWAKESTRQSCRRVVRVLGVDEISVRKGHKQYALVLSDLERRVVIDVLPNRQRDTLEEWFDKLTKKERRAIKVVSIDMWKPYRQAVRRKLSHAEIVADRFHVMKQLNHQIDLLRRALQKKADDTLYQVLKGNRWVLLKNRSELKPEEEAKLLVILDTSDELRDIYLLKEEFRTICDKIKDKARAERFLRAWMWKAVATGSRYLIRFVKTLRNWWHEFLNYFDDRVTQGFVEGTNRAIRGIINRAFGFRDFDNFRLQVLVECGGT
jgi:transposase